MEASKKINGKFICFEGGEASGKSTQAMLLQKAIECSNIKTTLVHEPGNSKNKPYLQDLRRVIFKYKWSNNTNILLFTASRAESLQFIKNAKKEDKVIICDRYILSTLAYQAKTEDTAKKILSLHENFVENIFPDITFIFDLSPFKTVERLTLRAKKKSLLSYLLKHKKDNADNFHKKDDISFHEKISLGFKNALKLCNNLKVIHVEADNTIENIHIDIIKKINEVFYANIVPLTIKEISKYVR